MVDMDKATGTIVGSIVAAVIVAIFGDVFVYDPATLGENETGIGFETGSAGANVVNVAPVLLVALGLYGGFQYM